MTMKKMENKIILLILATVLASCSLSPGMNFNLSKDNNNQPYVYIESIQERVIIENINKNSDLSLIEERPYRIGKGDQIAVTIWGLPEVFPITNISPDQNLRRVDSNGNIYFPFVGSLKAEGKTQTQLRTDLTKELSKNFNEPQVDLTIARFNSQKVFLLGEVTKPSKLFMTDIPITLADALGEVSGLNTNTSSASQVFVIRQAGADGKPRIFIADMSSPSAFVDAGKFFLKNNDIVYVNAKSTTRWNRVVSQFFPFSTFLASIDSLTN